MSALRRGTFRLNRVFNIKCLIDDGSSGAFRVSFKQRKQLVVTPNPPLRGRLF